MQPVVRVHAVVTGTVQGVGFRFWAARTAEALALGGYARNLVDGSVELEAQGGADAVESFVRMLHAGPRSAAVERVVTRPVDAVEEPGAFRILR